MRIYGPVMGRYEKTGELGAHFFFGGKLNELVFFFGWVGGEIE